MEVLYASENLASWLISRRIALMYSSLGNTSRNGYNALKSGFIINSFCF